MELSIKEQKKYLKPWAEIYQKHKFQSLCLDIEWSNDNHISLVGLYQPKDGPMDHMYLMRGKDLTSENLKQAFYGCKMLITYNGLRADVPAINKEFPGVLPKVPHIDLYLWARRLNLNTNLKVLENTVGVERMYDHSKRRFLAKKRWGRWIKYHDEHALNMLIEYNRQDTINLYPIAEKLVALVLNQ